MGAAMAKSVSTTIDPQADEGGPVLADAAVRADIAALKLSIEAARAAGYAVELPFPLEALDRIAISETGKVSG